MEHQAETVPDAKRRVILVVEDDVLLRFVISEALRNAGFQVVESADATQALAYIRAQNHVSLVFSDVHMPGGMNGIGLADALRADFPAVKIILTSGKLTLEEAGDIPLIPKPYILARVIADIRAALPPEPEPS
ncbi:MAG: response regulator [Alphaproteobacteria bacterium]|jgi:CheY-like chemotaxis protein|nr:response regulator [Alphaproteobacteria bacterium]